ncbi:hypothetical protein [Pseudonocardia sp. P1]|uniref:hypothetical protein n=1 Tax=Pseudonocardia sp. P1 TaxID=761194 RepID=UPI00307F72B8
MDSTMQQTELLVADLLEHGRGSTLRHAWCTTTAGRSTDTTFADVADEAARLAGGLRELG